MLFLFVTSCEYNEVFETPQTEATQSLFKVKTVKLEEIPEIKDYLNTKTNNIFYKESTDKDGAIFDIENIMEVIDTLNYTNYSFRFVYPDTPVSIFYNLVVGKTPEGEAKEPFVLKYVCDESHLDEFIINDFNLQYFKGKVGIHKYIDFFEDGNFYKGETYCPPNLDEYGDPIPCDKVTLDGSNPDGGGSENEGDPYGGYPSDGDTSGDDTSSDDTSSDDNSDDNTSSDTSGGEFQPCLIYDGNGNSLLVDCRQLKDNFPVEEKSTTSDCPDCPGPEGGIGINTTTIDINTILGEILNDEQLLWLSAHPEEEDAIKQYLKVNNSLEAEVFIYEAIDFLTNNIQFNFTQYENWFSSYYPDLELNTLEINPNDITYDTPLTQQVLPTFDTYISHFPKLGTVGNYEQMSSPDVYELVGGTLYTSHINDLKNYSNACSIRGSRGLLYSGINIPVLRYNNNQRTQKGGDNKNYILDAVSFNKFMIDKFGEATYKLEGVDANDTKKVANLLNGKNGIYIIINNSPGQAGYSGHVDSIINGICIGGAYTVTSGGIKSIRIWELN